MMIEAGDRPVPRLDADLIQAVAPVSREHGMHEAAAAMLRWSVAIMRGPHDTSERLRELAEDCREEHRRLGRAEEARRREGQDHG